MTSNQQRAQILFALAMVSLGILAFVYSRLGLAQRRSSTLRRPMRAIYIALALGTIVLGLSVHWHGGRLGSPLRDILGDALWAAMIAWWVGALAPGASLRIRAFVALAICFGVEVSQLYHTPMLDAVRATAAGRLVLGSGFDPRDLAAYTLGVLVAAFLERSVLRRHET